ncbi:MAG: hypothetical protein JWL83_2931, partial [Actinomycetia bacterium]|nr:hypothetical protein [Actinomycetes bacterium]
MKEKLRHVVAATFAATLLGVVAAAALPASGWADPPAADPIGGVPRFRAEAPGGNAAASAAALPTWPGSFTAGSTAYHYVMVGTDPAGGSATTTVPAQLLPVSFSFTGNKVIDAGPPALSLIASPIFTAQTFTSGHTQFADAMRRAEFWSTVSASAPNYHVMLGGPTVLQTAVINVPNSYGSYKKKKNLTYGMVDYNWFRLQLQSLLDAHGFAASTLPVVVSGNIFLYENGSEANCCVYGIHGTYTSASGTNTYVYGNYLSAGLAGKGNGKKAIADMYSMSHEITEWADDPYVNNVVPRWAQPGSG